MAKGKWLGLVVVGCLLGGCSGDTQVLYKDLETRVTHMILGYVFGDADTQGKVSVPDEGSEDLTRHRAPTADTSL